MIQRDDMGWEVGRGFRIGNSCVPAPSILYPVSNIDWQFVSYMIIYMYIYQ